jgi:hypothetical protein
MVKDCSKEFVWLDYLTQNNGSDIYTHSDADVFKAIFHVLLKLRAESRPALDFLMIMTFVT